LTWKNHWSLAGMLEQIALQFVGQRA
jgi:hypothetical protein